MHIFEIRRKFVPTKRGMKVLPHLSSLQKLGVATKNRVPQQKSVFWLFFS
jgi:hypothetical protein